MWDSDQYSRKNKQKSWVVHLHQRGLLSWTWFLLMLACVESQNPANLSPLFHVIGLHCHVSQFCWKFRRRREWLNQGLLSPLTIGTRAKHLSSHGRKSSWSKYYQWACTASFIISFALHGLWCPVVMAHNPGLSCYIWFLQNFTYKFSRAHGLNYPYGKPLNFTEYLMLFE